MIRDVRDAIVTVVFLGTLSLGVWALTSPATFGAWLQDIDEARYEFTMYE